MRDLPTESSEDVLVDEKDSEGQNYFKWFLGNIMITFSGVADLAVDAVKDVEYEDDAGNQNIEDHEVHFLLSTINFRPSSGTGT